MSQLEVQLFGPPTIRLVGAPVSVDTRKALALLAYLALTGQEHTRDALCALLWPEYDQQRSRAALRRTLSALKSALDGYGLHISRLTLALDTSADVSVDVLEFRRLLLKAEHHHPVPQPGCRDCLAWQEVAVGLYQDEFLAGFSLRDSMQFDDWQIQESESLRMELSRTLERVVAGHVQRGDFPPAVRHARRWLLIDPLREEAHRRLMQLYAWSGRRNEALQQYHECVRILNEELGVPPLAETTNLYRAIKENRLPSPPVPAVIEQVARELTATNQPARPAIAPLVGRDRELADVLAVYNRIGPQGALLVVSGESGVGKTALAETSAADIGRPFIIGRCFESEMNLAYGCFSQALRDGLQAAGAAGRLAAVPPHWQAEAGRLVPEIHTITPDLPEPPPMSGPGAQSRFMEGVVSVLEALSAHDERPGVLFLDDVHWADEASLDLLTYLVHRLRRHALMVLVTWRDEAVPTSHRLRRLLTDSERVGAARHIMLDRLGPDETTALVQARNRCADEEFSRRLYAETEGLPYFLVEYLSMVADSTTEAGGSRGRDWRIPQGVRDLLHARIATVSETAQQLLHAAAVIGRVFDFELLRAASGRSEDETLTGLELLLSRGLVSELVDGASAPSPPIAHSPQYDFRHHKLRELVYEEMNLARRRILHRRIADALAQHARRQPQPDAMAGWIAHHYLAGGLEEAAAEYSRAAGNHARALYANHEALVHYQTALALGLPAKVALHEACGDLYTRLGEYGSALESYEAALASAEPADVGRLEHRLGLVQQRLGNWGPAESHFIAALDAYGTQETALKARLLSDWSRNAYQQRDMPRAIALAEDALSQANAAEDDGNLAQIYNILGMLARAQRDLPAARAHLDRSLRVSEVGRQQTTPNPDLVAALNNLALVCADEQAFDQGLVLLERALVICRELGERHYEAALQNNIADLLRAAGRREEAMARLKEAVAIFAEIGSDGGSQGEPDRGEWQPEIWKLAQW